MTSSAVEPDFDVIVIGAGVAGCVTAFLLGSQGRSVLLIERGEAPGAKNLSGGVLYCRSMEAVFPDFLTRAPIERRITRNHISFLNKDSAVGIDYQDARLADPTRAVTVLRAELDAWLADQCAEAGVMVMPGVRVDKVLVESGPETNRVVGVQAGDDELRAHVVVAADGINSFIAREAGLRHKPPKNHLAVGVKGVVSLPREVIEERFNLVGDEGAALTLVGDCTQGVGGGGFCYTNAESVSIGIVLRLDDLAAKQKIATEIFDHFLAHPIMAKYLTGGELLEYGCHLVAEGGLEMLGETVMDGMVVVGDAAGLTLNTGLTIRGMDLAVVSATAAASTIGEAIDRQDTSAKGLAVYRERLLASSVGKDLQLYASAPHFMERERLYGQYGELLAQVMHGVFDLDGTPRKPLSKLAWDSLVSSPLSIRDVIGDVMAGVRAL